MVAPIATLADDFTSGLNRSIWVSSSPNPNTYYDASNQRIGIQCTGSFYTLGTDFSAPAYSIQNSSVFCKFNPSTPVAGRESHFDLQTTGRASVISFVVYGVNLIATTTPGTDVASAPYNPVAHAWLRIRHSAGNIIWETSPDGFTWTAFGTRAYSYGFDAWALNLSCGGSVGPDMFVDNINVLPPAAIPTPPVTVASAWQPFSLRRNTGGDSLRPTSALSMGKAASGFSTGQEHGSGATDLLLSQQVNLMVDLGVGWHRSDYPVKNVSPTAGTFNFANADRWIIQALNKGITPLPVLYILPTWMNGSANDKTPPTNNADFASWCATACQHLYSLGVRYVEIWNEPNLATFWNVPAVTDANYRVAWAALMNAVYPAIKAVTPGMTVITGGLSTTDTVFQTLGTPAVPGKGALSTFQRWGELGVFANCDAVAWHPYLDSDLPCVDVGGWPAMNLASAQAVLTILDTFAAGRNLRLWTTETGAPRSVTGTQVEQSNRAHNVFATVMPAGCMASIRSRMGPIFWFTVIDRPSGGAREQSFGFVSNDLATHYTVYNTMKTDWATAWPVTDAPLVQSSLRYGPQDFPFDTVKGSALSGIPWGYDSAYVTVQVPPTVPSRGEMVLVRGGFGYPTTPLDGEPVWYHADSYTIPITDQVNQIVLDKPLTQGRWYYYTLFVNLTSLPYPQPAVWTAAATAKVLVPRNYGHAEKLFAMIPPFYQGVDNQQAADGQNGQLRRYLAIIGYDADYNRTLLDGILDLYDPDRAPLVFTQQLGANLGLPPEQALGGARYRSLVGQLWELEGQRGTKLGLQEMIYAASNYQAIVVQGYNALLSPDDAEFVNGVGHWQPYTNPHVVDMTNAVGTTHPPNDLYTYLQTRKYTGAFNGTTVATTLTLPAMLAEQGRGVMEIIEILVSLFPGLYGAQGTITGPSTNYPQTLAALIAAAPPVTAGLVPNYYASAAAGWWAGDVYTLPNGDTSHWSGSAWVTGPGIVARPALQYVNAGAPAWMFPLGALRPANLTALATGGIVVANTHPPVPWKAGEYVLLADGTTWHPEYQVAQSHPVINWVAGVSTLTIPATRGALGPISGYMPRWQTASGAMAIAPADFATLRATVPMILGYSPQSSITDRPWTPAQPYEVLYLYDSTKASWVGQAFSMPGGSPANSGLLNVVQLNTAAGGTGTVWSDAGAIVAGASTSKVMTFSVIASVSGNVPTAWTLNAGWNRIAWPIDSTATGINWTNASGDRIGWTPASSVFAEFNCLFYGGGAAAGPTLAGTIVALFIDGNEHSRSTSDGSHSLLAHFTNAQVNAGQVAEIRIWSPAVQSMYSSGSTYHYSNYPILRIGTAIPINAGFGVWKASQAGHYSISAVLTPSSNYTINMPWWIMKNRQAIASGYLNADIAEQCRLVTDVDIAVNDTIYVAVQRIYVPAGQYITYLGANSPRLTMARWEVA